MTVPNSGLPLWSRRRLLQQSGLGFGALALDQLMQQSAAEASTDARGGRLSALHHPAKAKRVIFLFQSGAPSQMDLFDYKPLLNEKHGTALPDEA